jgi:hypothetical protein
LPPLYAMFVPRALRLKGVRETKPKPSKPPPEVTQRRQDEALVDAMQGISTNSPTPQEEQIEPKAIPRGGPKFTVKAVTPEYLSQLVVGMELIFSDYAHREEVRADWLQQRYRTVDEGEYCKIKHGKICFQTLTVKRSHPSHGYPRASEHLEPQASSDARITPTGTPGTPIQDPRALEQWLPYPPHPVFLSPQISSSQLIRAGQR